MWYNAVSFMIRGIIMTDTIAAIATGMTAAGIGIIRISGEEAVTIVSSIFKTPSGKKLVDVESHTIHYGHIMDGEELYDEVLVSVMRAPHSYTGEDTVEINCHGGLFVCKKILDLVIRFGARMAEPGEFTKRSFLNGKKDLSESEAVMDVISAKSDQSLKNSLKHLSGGLYKGIHKMRDEILYEIAYIESALDDPEHISLEGYSEKLEEKMTSLVNRLQTLIDTYDRGCYEREGIGTVLLGKPNAGKSSILNILAGKERAIVTEIPGTTRDTLEETVRLGMITLRLMDTAGIRHTDDTVEKIGVNRALEAAKEADLILYIIDRNDQLSDDFSSILEELSDKNVIILLNKSDLEGKITENTISSMAPGVPILSVCAEKEHWEKTKEKLNTLSWVHDLEEIITKMFFENGALFNEEILLSNIRHKKECEEAKESLLHVKDSIAMDMPEDFLSIDLMAAYSHLGYIIGEEVDDDLVDEIFSKFCMGK